MEREGGITQRQKNVTSGRHFLVDGRLFFFSPIYLMSPSILAVGGRKTRREIARGSNEVGEGAE